MDGDFYGEYVLATIEKNINQIILEFQKYIKDYENEKKYLYHVDIDALIHIQNL
jgi:hypothetical protein